MTDVPVSGAVIKWARDFRGLTLEEAADKLGWPADELRAYEDGKRKPTLSKFEKVADVYRLPQATLFVRTPPAMPAMPRDFRTREGVRPQFSFEFRVALSNVRTLQRTLRILRGEDEDFRVAKLPRYSQQDDP